MHCDRYLNSSSGSAPSRPYPADQRDSNPLQHESTEVDETTPAPQEPVADPFHCALERLKKRRIERHHRAGILDCDEAAARRRTAEEMGRGGAAHYPKSEPI